MERQRQLEEENKLLKQRRKANQRKICDANLADRRAAVAQEKAAACQRALSEFCVRDHAQALAAKRGDALERQLAEVRVQLAAEVEMRRKFEAIAQPPKEKFFNHGHFTTDVDLVALEVCRAPAADGFEHTVHM